METLLLTFTNLILGISAAQSLEIPAPLLQTHPTVAPIAQSLPLDSSQKPSIKGPVEPKKLLAGRLEPLEPVSDSNEGDERGYNRTRSSLKLQRGEQGEAFLTSEEPAVELAQVRPPAPAPTTKISDTPIVPQSTISQPSLRPSIDLPITGGPNDSNLLKRPNQGPGTDVYQRDSTPLPPNVTPRRITAPGDDNANGTAPGTAAGSSAAGSNAGIGSSSSGTELDVQPTGGVESVKSRVINHGDEFPADIDNISPSATTEDQVPEKPGTVPGTVSATITYEEKVREHPSGGSMLTIFEALDQALVKSPRAAALRALLPVTQSELARATEQPGPDWMYDNGVAAEQTRRTGAVFNFEPPWKLVFRLLAAKRLIEQNKQELLTQLWGLRAEVRLAYTEVVVAQETLETLNSLYDLAHQLMIVSSKRFQAGDVPELDMLKARLAESQYDVERRVGLRRVIRAKQQLNVIMGRKPETPLQIPRLPPFLTTADIAKAAGAHNILLPDFQQRIQVLESYLDLAIKHRYELRALERQIAVNKAQLRTSYGNIFPSPQFWMGSSQTGNPPTGPRLNSYYFGVNVPTNLTSFQQGDIAKYKAVERQLRYQNGSLRNVITSEVSSAYNNVLAARQKLRIYQEHVLADSYEVARLARRSYEVGQSDITSTIQAQQNNVQIRTQYLEAIQLYQQAFTELERACGTPLLEAMD
ncbi:MAG: TolC family protein [Candidatus Melainabacteria bacterium]|nr:TolC family protein [Candidatus Melainabacteria bacterium]